MNFNKDTLIGEILEVSPDKADILLCIVYLALLLNKSL